MSLSGGTNTGAPDSNNSGDKQSPQIIQKPMQSGSATFPINLAPNKIGHVKPATIDAIKVAGPIQANIGGSAGGNQMQTTFRPVTTRVVMPPGTIVPGTMIKQINAGQIDSNSSGAGNVRAQITAIPARTVSQTSITVTRSITPTTYIPRAGVNTATIQTTQRMTAPIRSSTPPTVTNLATGTFVRGTSVARNSSSPATTVISPTNATWMATGGQVQLIRTISHQPRQRLITQNISSNVANSANVVSGSNAAAGIVAVGQVSGSSPNSGNTGQAISHPSSIQTSQQQQTFVATVLPPRQQTATLVYSNVSNSQGQQYPSGQRYTVATSLTGTGQRQVRPIQLNNRAFSTATKLGAVSGMNTSISIRAPNTIPVLTPTINSGNTSNNTIQGRLTTASGGNANVSVSSSTSGSSGNVNLPTNSLTTTRIIQLQQQPGTGGQQLIGPSGQRITSNLMLQPIIMNTTGKLNIRTPATVNAKGSSSLTITQLGSLTKQSGASLSGLQGASISQSPINQSGATVVASVASSGTIVQQTSQQSHQQNQQSQSQQNQPTSVSLSVSGNQQPQQPITQIVSVNQALSGSGNAGQSGQIISTQNVPVSATVVPLAISSKGAANVFTGNLNTIKTGTGVAGSITKVISQSLQQHSQQQHQPNSSSHAVTEIITSQSGQGQHHQPTSVFIHARPPSSGSGSSGSTAVIPNSGTFLPAGGTFYYESVPANSVSVSTGVLSLTTTTVTSTVSSNQPITSISAGSISTSHPFTPSGSSAGGTFTVVPASAVTNITGNLGGSSNTTGTRTIGQIQIPVSGSLPAASSASSTITGNNSGTTQLQSVPIRFASQTIQQHNLQSQQQHQQSQQHTQQMHTVSSGSTNNEQLLTTTLSGSQHQQHSQSSQQQQQPQQQQQQIITMTAQSSHTGQLASGNTGGNAQTAHMIIPIQTSSIKLAGTPLAAAAVATNQGVNQRHTISSNNSASCSGSNTNLVQTITNLSSVNTAFLRKRDAEGSPIRAAKNLAPTLLSMGTTVSTLSGSPPVSLSSNSSGQVVGLNVSGIAQNQSTNLVATIQQQNSSNSNSGSNINILNQQKDLHHHLQRAISPISRPGSSDGSTTVSANSSPGLDQQMNEELQPMNCMNSDSHFNPINDMYANHQNHIPSSISRMRRPQQHPQQQQQQQQQSHHQQQQMPSDIQMSQSSVSNGNMDFTPPRKKARRSTNDSQNSNASHHQLMNSQSTSYMPVQNSQIIDTPGSLSNSAGSNNVSGGIGNNNMQDSSNKVNNNVVNNKENAKPTDYIIKKPKACNLLDSYKYNWKAANNHFQRYSDVKPREERRPTVMDLANQSNIKEAIAGWRIYHLSAQMEDLCEVEGQVYDKLNEMLKKFEIHGKSADLDRVSELIKANMQRSKIISDGVNEARTQMMKIFEHKNHVSDIIHRCASKRNFKKRDKP